MRSTRFTSDHHASGRMVCLLIASLHLSNHLLATPVQFTIDASKSQITLSGNVSASRLTEQAPGSLTTSFSGNIFADVSAAGIRFTGGSTLTALTNGVWQPGPKGASGSAPADYGGLASLFGIPLKGALRNLLLDVTSTVLPLTNGGFDASALVFAFPPTSTASFDYDAVLTKGGVALSGQSTNKIGSTASLTGPAGSQALSIQIDTEFTFSSPVSGAVHLTGTLTSAQSVQFSITSIAVQNQTVTIQVSGTTPTSALQVSGDLKSWGPQAATRTDNGTDSLFTFPASGAAAFFRVQK